MTTTLIDHVPVPATTDWAIETHNLSLRLGDLGKRKVVLQGVTLAIPTGAVVGLVGRNGAGKTSLLDALVGRVVPQQGTARLLGSPSADLPDSVRERLGYVAQTPDLFDYLTGQQHCDRLGAAYADWDDERALELAHRLNLSLRTTAAKLSLGDQQKLSLVLALGHDPDLLILDEPVASLDPITRREFMRTLFERRATDAPPRTVVISSHLLSDLERVVTHLAFLRQGEVQLFGEADAIAEHLRMLELPEDSLVQLPKQGVISRIVRDGCVRVVYDTRIADTPPAIGRRLGLEDLFVELNT